MFCPQCGTRESDELKFCKACGSNLSAVRHLVSKRGTDDKTGSGKNWIAEVVRARAEAQSELERQRGITPEVRRLREVKAGVITASAGVALAVFLSVFMEGIIQGGRLGSPASEILSRLWVVGVIPLCIGLGLLINGLFVKSAAKTPDTAHLLEQEERRQSLESGMPPEHIPSAFSVTEETTRHLTGVEQKD